jgi:di/tricarboxylate transporter
MPTTFLKIFVGGFSFSQNLENTGALTDLPGGLSSALSLS